MAKKQGKAKELQGELADSAHKIWLAGLGALALAEEESSKLFKNLVAKGQGIEERGRDQVEKARGTVSGMRTVAESYWETFERTVDEKITAAIHRIGVPTKGEIETLTTKVEELTESIEKLHTAEKGGSKSAGRSRTTTKKAATSTGA